MRLRPQAAAVLDCPLAGLAAPIAALVPFSLPLLFLTFLKIGAVLYGSGYVLLAFLRADFVVRLGWLTDHQLLDAIAIGQVTPGPVFTTATFIGYLLGGVLRGRSWRPWASSCQPLSSWPSADPWIPRIRNSAWAADLLDGVNVASLGLMLRGHTPARVHCHP